MIALDTSSLVSYLAGDSGHDVEIVDDALRQGTAVLPPPVLSELLSDPGLASAVVQKIKGLRLLDILPDLWMRAGELRRRVLAKKLKSRLADALIAQICIDHDVPLLTRDKDFRHYAKVGGLRLI